MPLTQDQWQQTEHIVASAETVRAAAATLREQLAPVRTLVLDALDMRGEQPALSIAVNGGGGRAVYLMTTDGHCWSVTHDLAHASALVLTQA